jgi:hypothetical protein
LIPRSDFRSPPEPPVSKAVAAPRNRTVPNDLMRKAQECNSSANPLPTAFLRTEIPLPAGSVKSGEWC